MSFLHLVYAGEFEVTEQSHLRMTRTPDDPIWRPVIARPLDLSVVDRLASECSLPGKIGVAPEGSPIWLEDGYLVCDRYALGFDEILFLRRLVAETGCRLFERAFEVSVDDLAPKRRAVEA